MEVALASEDIFIQRSIECFQSGLFSSEASAWDEIRRSIVDTVLNNHLKKVMFRSIKELLHSKSDDAIVHTVSRNFYEVHIVFLTAEIEYATL